MRHSIVRLLILTTAWAALQGSFGFWNIVVGLLLSLGVLWFLRPLYDDAQKDPRPWGEQLKQMFWVVELGLFFVYELVKSGLQVARIVLQPKMQLSPGIIALPLDARTDLEITMLANLISLTPGTLSLEVSPDKERLFIHALSVDGEEAHEARAYIKRTLERRVIRALGRRKGPG